MPQAIQVEKTGGPEVLGPVESDPGRPAPGQVRVRTAAAGVNFIDCYMRSGAYPRPVPFVAGLEGAGVIEEVGPDVADLAVGDRVAWASVPGSYAEIVIAPAAGLVRVPGVVADDLAAASMPWSMPTPEVRIRASPRL